MGKIVNQYTPSRHVLPGPRHPRMGVSYIDEIFRTSLTIADQVVDADIVTLSCRATHDEQTVGFDLSVPRICYAGLSGSTSSGAPQSVATLRPGAVFTHSGFESETFTRALTDGLGLPVAAARNNCLRDDIALSVIHLSHRDIDLTRSQTCFKLLFERASATRLYWEAQLRVDIPGRTVDLSEQCPNFRAAMAATFCQSWGPERATCMQHLA